MHSSTPSQQAAPPPAPTGLADVDSQLKALGYAEGQDFRQIGGGANFRQTGVSEYNTPTGNYFNDPNVKQANPAAGRIQQLLNYRSQFQAADDKLRTSAPNSRASTIFTSPQGDLTTPNKASRTLLGV